MSNVIKPSVMAKSRTLLALAKTIRSDLARFSELSAEIAKGASATPLAVATTHQILRQSVDILKLSAFSELIKTHHAELLDELNEMSRLPLTSAAMSIADHPIPAFSYKPKLAVSASIPKEASLLGLMQFAIDNGAGDLLERRVRSTALVDALGQLNDLGNQLLDAGLVNVETRLDWSVTKAK